MVPKSLCFSFLPGMGHGIFSSEKVTFDPNETTLESILQKSVKNVYLWQCKNRNESYLLTMTK